MKKIKKHISKYVRHIAFALALIATNTTCLAGTITVGPVQDFKGYKTTTIKTTLPTAFTIPVSLGLFGYDLASFNINITDSIDVKVNLPTPIYAASYFEIDYPDELDENPPFSSVENFFASTAPSTVTDVWAFDLNPSGSDIILEGFTPSSPQIEPLSDEIFFGLSGTEYPATVIQTTVGSLPSLLPGHDLSAFSGADPLGVVYFASTQMPVNEVGTVVPEPSTLALIGLAGGGVLFIRRYRLY